MLRVGLLILLIALTGGRALWGQCEFDTRYSARHETKRLDLDTLVYFVEQVDSVPRPSLPNEELYSAVKRWARERTEAKTFSGDRTLHGEVILSLVIEADGTPSHPEIYGSLSPEHDHIALEIIGLMPRWIPARLGNRAVRCRYYYPVVFVPEVPQSIPLQR